MLEVAGGGKPLKKKESGGSMKDAIKRRFTAHKPQFPSDVVDAFEKIKSFSQGGYETCLHPTSLLGKRLNLHACVLPLRYLLKIDRPPEKGSDHARHESVVIKWRAPIDHPTSDWIGTNPFLRAAFIKLLCISDNVLLLVHHAPLPAGIWPVGSRHVRKLGRVLQMSDETPTRPCSGQPVAAKCWAFVPKGRKGTIAFSGTADIIIQIFLNNSQHNSKHNLTII
jgi:hypothetical protein